MKGCYFRIEILKNIVGINHSILNILHVSVHFLYSSFLLFFKGIRESPKSICLPKENEPKEKALYRQVFFKDRLKNRSLKTIFQKLNFLQGFKNF